jgi:succinate-semialdehyde dehydrogenase/glutarate-semialdehyde dehydrogenase
MTGVSSTAAARQLKTINPATEQVLKEYVIFTKEQLSSLVKQARQTFLEWRNNIDRRAEYLYSFAKELRKNKENLAKPVTQEVGKAKKKLDQK